MGDTPCFRQEAIKPLQHRQYGLPYLHWRRLVKEYWGDASQNLGRKMVITDESLHGRFPIIGARAGCPKSLRIWLLSQGNPNNLVKWCKPPRLACGLLSHTPTVKSAGPSPPANFPPSWHPLPDTFLHPTYNRRSNLHPGVLYKSLLIMSHSYIPQVVHSTGNKDSK